METNKEYKYINIDELNIDDNEELRKLKKMINLSMNNSNENESKAAMKMAERFARKHKIDLERILSNHEDSFNEVFEKRVTLDTTKYTAKYRMIYESLNTFRNVLPVEIYMSNSYRKVYGFYYKYLAYTAYSNFKDTIIIFDELFEYVKYIWSFRTGPYIASFIRGFASVFASSYEIRSLIPLNDTGIKGTEIDFSKYKAPDRDFDMEGYQDGKKWNKKSDRKKLEEEREPLELAYE